MAPVRSSPAATDDPPNDARRGRSTDTRQELVRAALDIIAERGIDALKIEDVASAVGVTKGSIYWHFTDRSALVQAALALHIDELLAEALDGFEDAIEQATSTDDYLLRIAPYVIDAYDPGFIDRRWQRLEMLCAIRRDPQLWEQAQKIQAQALDRFTELMTKAQAAGFLRADIDPKALTTVIHMINMGSVCVDLLGADAPAPDTIHGVMMHFITILFPDTRPAGA